MGTTIIHFIALKLKHILPFFCNKIEEKHKCIFPCKTKNILQPFIFTGVEQILITCFFRSVFSITVYCFVLHFIFFASSATFLCVTSHTRQINGQTNRFINFLFLYYIPIYVIIILHYCNSFRIVLFKRITRKLMYLEYNGNIFCSHFVCF